MPIYEYQVTRTTPSEETEDTNQTAQNSAPNSTEEEIGCDYCRDGFEVFQNFADDVLTVCPKCGVAVHRVFSEFSTGNHYEKKLSPKTLGEHGFTQYKKAGDGYYEKTCGDGPRLIHKDGSAKK
ncbi:MAG: zinc ribbon domain-containing protein [Thermoguttaceae bacterium]|nr:zinc ribbon domain-containing protein [Thermoguttaceae bacterium]